jgi:hypothetical protein
MKSIGIPEKPMSPYVTTRWLMSAHTRPRSNMRSARLILRWALAALAAARSRATFSLGVSSEPLPVLKGEFVET